MIRNFYFISLLLLVLFSGSCKKNTWIDWKVQNAVWLAENSRKDSIIVTPTGLQYKVLRQGIKGTKPDALKSVRINYTGRLITGDVFDQSQNVSFSVSGMIDGMAEGLKKMNQSGHYILYIPQELGYGSDAQGIRGGKNYVPPYSTLIFDVELLEVY